MKRLRRSLLTVLALVLSAAGIAQVPESERTRVTDPDRLEAMGFPRDATNVYVAKNLDRVPSEADDFGGDYHFTPLSSADFNPPEQVTVLAERYASIHLPTGVQIEAFRWWAFDDDPSQDLYIRVYESCQPPFVAGPPVFTQVGSGQTSGSDGHQSGVLAGGGYTVSNLNCHSFALLFWDPDADPSDLYLQKLRVQWSRQVSPAPSTASFGDVPTNHPFFQFVEALAAAGITGGCGGGNFCPDAPLTRGQMAVFLAVALGLHFP
jgi:hypothetical protein